MDSLFSIGRPFAHPVTLYAVIAAGAALVLTPLVTLLLSRVGGLSTKTRADIAVRHRTWLFLAPAMVIPVLLAPGAAMLLVCIFSLLCYREFARATGLFRHRLLSAIVALGIILLTLAAADNWYGLFISLPALTVTVVCAVGVLADQPSGYIQRVALAAISFLLFGVALSYLSFIANDSNYRPIFVLLLAGSQGSDMLAYVCGKAFGRRKVFPHTSPNKTLGGHLGALLLVVPLAAWLGHLVFPGTGLDHPGPLIGLGLIVAVGAQLGDLVLGSIKRDLGVKDLAATLPGHGGFTDRFNSLLLIAPAVFHYVNYFGAFTFERPPRVFF